MTEASSLHEEKMTDVQAGFGKKGGTLDLIMNIPWLPHCSKGFQKEISLHFIDFIKVFDCTHHKKLLVALGKKTSVSQHLNVLIHNLYCESKAAVRTGYSEAEWFPTGKSVRQGYILPPLFV